MDESTPCLNPSIIQLVSLTKTLFIILFLCLGMHKVWWDPSAACALCKDDSCSQKEHFVGGPLDTETIVEFSYYLLEIQLHDPTVKVPSLDPL